MVLRKALRGELQLYVHPRYTVFVTIAAIVLLVIGEMRLLQRSRGERSARRRLGVYGLLLLPLLLGMLVPARPADTAQGFPQHTTHTGTAQVVVGTSDAARGSNDIVPALPTTCAMAGRSLGYLPSGSV